MNSTMTRIDGGKLRMALNLKGLQYTKVSTELGYSNYFLGSCMNANRIRKAIIPVLEEKYGIPYDAYKYVEPTPEPKPEPAELPQSATELELEVHDEVYRDIEHAMYQAMKRAIADSVDVIVEAVTKAWKEL